MQTQIEHPTRVLLAVEVPDGADNFRIFNDIGRPYLSYFVCVETHREYLPDAEWSILGMWPEITEEQAGECLGHERAYKIIRTTLESLLISNGVKVEGNKVVLLIKNN